MGTRVKNYSHVFAIVLMGILKFSTANCQLHLDLERSGNYSFTEIVQLSEDHFKIVGKGKGVGYKQFQRWKYWAERNLDQYGNVRDDRNSLNVFNRFAKSTDASARNLTGQYVELGPLSTTNTSTSTPALGRVSAIGLDPNNDNHIVVGSPTGGIWNTYNLGDTWTPLFDDQALIDVYSLEISHSDPDHYYAGLSNGVVRSFDAGQNWVPVAGLSSSQQYNTITMHPTNANIIFAVAENSGVVYKSVDSGDNFYAVMDHNSTMYDLEFHPTNSSVIYASGSDAVYVSIDDGESFTEVTSGLWSGNGNSMMIAVTESAPNNVYVLEERSGGFNAVYVSQNSGASWTVIADNTCNCNNIMGYDLNSQNGQAPRDMDILVSPVNPNIIHVAGVETWRSVDFGQNWTKTSAYANSGGSNFIHADIDILIYDDNRIVAGTDGGIYYSENEATSWTDITSGLGIRQFYKIGASQTDVDRVSGGSQDNGTGVVRDGVWYNYEGADGGETFIDWSNEDILYCSKQFGALSKSLDGGQTLVNINTPGGDSKFITPIEQDPLVANTLYTARQQVFKSTNGGGSWTAISNFDSGKADEMKIAPMDNQYIYVSFGNKMYRTTDGGANWDMTTLPGSSVNYIAMHPSDPTRLAVTLSGTTSKLMESIDGGVTWMDRTINLPDVAMECVYYELNGLGGLYAGGNPGIYYYDAVGSGSWSTITNNLPKVRISEFEIRNQVLYIGTFGRGLWKYDLPCDPILVGQPCDDTDICTINDVLDNDCNCLGTPVPDSDGDGFCDLIDQCPGFDDAIDLDFDDISDGCDSSISCDDCVTTISSFPFVEDFENGTNNLCQFDTDDFDWLILQGATASSNTGPPSAYSGSNYFYIESSSPNNPSKSAIFKSACFDLSASTDASIDFWYHMFGGTIGTLDLLISSNNGEQWESIWTLSGDQGNAWLNQTIDLSSYTGSTVSFAFHATTTNFFTSDIAIDFLTISAGNGCSSLGGDADNDGVCAANDCDDNDSNVGGVNSSCNDGDVCTINDKLDVNCNCTGTFDDADNDGVCALYDCDDFDPNVGVEGSSCDDGDPCTNNDVISADCFCEGTFEDADNDGVCVGDDCDDNDASIGVQGSSCDDGDPCTFNDLLNASCNCEGTLEDADNDGVCTLYDCDDNDPSIGIEGASCDDGDPCTLNDLIGIDCNCEGTFEDADNDGVCSLYDCDDNDPSIGMEGASCDDGDPCTLNDLIGIDCNCEGTFEDADNDGVCSLYDCDDNDPSMGMEGASCDDGDPCTLNDLIGIDCNCEGTFEDADNDGICTADDPNDDDPCVPDDSSPLCSIECSIYNSTSFESGIGIWNDGGSDCTLLNNNNNAYTGTSTVRIRDNSGAASSMFTDNLDLSNLEEVRFSYVFKAKSMEVGENFIIELSTDGGSTYSPIKDWISGTNFNNNQFYFDTITLLGEEVNNSTRFRIRCDASGNNDKIFIDDIVIETCAVGDASEGISRIIDKADVNAQELSANNDIVKITNLEEALIFPNPADDHITVRLTTNKNVDYKINFKSILGQSLNTTEVKGLGQKQDVQIDCSSWLPGLYIVELRSLQALAVKTIVIR